MGTRGRGDLYLHHWREVWVLIVGKANKIKQELILNLFVVAC